MHRKTRRVIRRGVFFISLFLAVICLAAAAGGYLKLWRLSTGGLTAKLIFLGTSSKTVVDQNKNRREYNYIYYSQFQFTDNNGNVHQFGSSHLTGNDLTVLYDPVFPQSFIVGEKVPETEYFKVYFLFAVASALIMAAIIGKIGPRNKSHVP